MPSSLKNWTHVVKLFLQQGSNFQDLTLIKLDL